MALKNRERTERDVDNAYDLLRLALNKLEDLGEDPHTVDNYVAGWSKNVFWDRRTHCWVEEDRV